MGLLGFNRTSVLESILCILTKLQAYLTSEDRRDALSINYIRFRKPISVAAKKEGRFVKR